MYRRLVYKFCQLIFISSHFYHVHLLPRAGVAILHQHYFIASTSFSSWKFHNIQSNCSIQVIFYLTEFCKQNQIVTIVI